jgi:hypothetical protein
MPVFFELTLRGLPLAADGGRDAPVLLHRGEGFARDDLPV